MALCVCLGRRGKATLAARIYREVRSHLDSLPLSEDQRQGLQPLFESIEAFLPGGPWDGKPPPEPWP